jgi:single-stranded-DNA-specific exonuclease RecJ
MKINNSCDNILNLITMHDSYLLSGVGYALYRITKAVNEREKIVIYGSYDLDGITSVSLLMLTLKYLNADVEYYIPDVIDDGDIFNANVIKDHIKLLGAQLIITVGCGINSVYEVELCKSLGIDVIITDYHKPEKKLPDTIVINPNQEGCTYPFKHLSAVGISYKLAYAIAEHYHVQSIEKYLDLVAIGIVAANAPLIGENLLMLQKGIYHLANSNNYGIKAITKLNDIIDIDYEAMLKISAIIMPKVNAVGRMDDARIVVELFTTSEAERAEQIVKYMKKNNNISVFYTRGNNS